MSAFSGGLQDVWRIWENMLHAVGIDALVKERSIDCGQSKRNPHVSYEAALVIGPSTHADAASLRSNYALHRTSAYLGTILNRLGSERATALSTSEFLELWDRVTTGELHQSRARQTFATCLTRISDPFYSHYQRLFEKAIGLTNVEVADRRENARRHSCRVWAANGRSAQDRYGWL